MPRGKNYVNNNKGVFLQKKKSTQMIACVYGVGCTRRDCIYRHPHGRELDDARSSSSSGGGGGGGKARSSEPCMPYLAGMCTFANGGCWKRHPPKKECEQLVARYRATRCRFGDSCRTKGCLYVHPGDDEGGEGAASEAGGAAPPTTVVYPPLQGHTHPAAAVGSGGLAWVPDQFASQQQRYPSPQEERGGYHQHAAAPQALSPSWNMSSSVQDGLGGAQCHAGTTAASYDTSSSDAVNGVNINAKEFVPGNGWG